MSNALCFACCTASADDCFARGHAQALQQQDSVDNVHILDDLLLGNGLDDPDLPGVYQGESDAEEFGGFMPSVGGCSDEDETDIRSLEAILGTGKA